MREQHNSKTRRQDDDHRLVPLVYPERLHTPENWHGRHSLSRYKLLTRTCRMVCRQADNRQTGQQAIKRVDVFERSLKIQRIISRRVHGNSIKASRFTSLLYCLRNTTAPFRPHMQRKRPSRCLNVLERFVFYQANLNYSSYIVAWVIIDKGGKVKHTQGMTNGIVNVSG
ncbi:hypothetical protein CBL_01213 [Carabus blaptoides fortunei]